MCLSWVARRFLSTQSGGKCWVSELGTFTPRTAAKCPGVSGRLLSLIYMAQSCWLCRSCQNKPLLPPEDEVCPSGHCCFAVSGLSSSRRKCCGQKYRVCSTSCCPDFQHNHRIKSHKLSTFTILFCQRGASLSISPQCLKTCPLVC